MTMCVGCAVDADSDLLDDAGTDTVVDGKADTGGIAEGTPQACGVLRASNTSTRAQLRDDVGLTNIVAQYHELSPRRRRDEPKR